MENHNQDARYATDHQRDDQAGARILEKMEDDSPEITAMVVHVATAYMAEKAKST